MSDASNVGDYINQYGFPIIASGSMGYIVYFVWIWATTIVKPILEQAHASVVDLIDQVRILDNDMIRLKQKIETILLLKGRKDK